MNQTQKYCAKSAFTKSINCPQTLIGPLWWLSHQRLQRSASWRSWLKSAVLHKTRVAIGCSLLRIRLCPVWSVVDKHAWGAVSCRAARPSEPRHDKEE